MALSQLANVLLPGLYAWSSTVLTPVLEPGVSTAARAAAGVALACLVSGALLAPRKARISRALGVLGFVGASSVSWVLVGGRLSPERVDAVRAVLGALGWVLFAFGWGSLRAPGRVPEDDPRALPGPPLRARGKLPFGATLVLGAALLAAAAPLVLAWRVHQNERALLAHSVALLCAIGLIEIGSEIAVERGRERLLPPGRVRLKNALGSVLLLAFVSAIGILVSATR